MPVVVGVGLLAATGCFTGLYFSHLPAYLVSVLHYDARQAVLAQTVGVVAHAIGILLVGWIADRVSPLRLLRVGAVLILLFAFPFYHALAARAMALTTLLVLGGVCGGLINGTFAVLLTDLFPTRIRFSGVALSFNVAFTIFSGMAPFAATALIRATGSLSSPAALIGAGAVLALAASFGVPRFGGHVLKPAAGRSTA
jgi:MFS family permease